MTAPTQHVRFRRTASGRYAAGAYEITRAKRSGLYQLREAGRLHSLNTYLTLDDARQDADRRAGARQLSFDDAPEVEAEAAVEVETVVDLDALLEVETTVDTLFVVPCAATKADTTRPARELYTSQNFRATLAAAELEAAATTRDLGTPARVVILSALHGLLELDQLVAPYDLKMGDAGSVTAELVTDQLAAIAPATICAMLPRAYGNTMKAAADQLDADYLDAYEFSPGIGYQRGTVAAITRNAA